MGKIIYYKDNDLREANLNENLPEKESLKAALKFVHKKPWFQIKWERIL